MNGTNQSDFFGEPHLASQHPRKGKRNAERNEYAYKRSKKYEDQD